MNVWAIRDEIKIIAKENKNPKLVLITYDIPSLTKSFIIFIQKIHSTTKLKFFLKKLFPHSRLILNLTPTAAKRTGNELLNISWRSKDVNYIIPWGKKMALYPPVVKRWPRDWRGKVREKEKRMIRARQDMLDVDVSGMVAWNIMPLIRWMSGQLERKSQPPSNLFQSLEHRATPLFAINESVHTQLGPY